MRKMVILAGKLAESIIAAISTTTYAKYLAGLDGWRIKCQACTRGEGHGMSAQYY